MQVVHFLPPQQPPYLSYREALQPKGSVRGSHHSDISACSRGGVGLQRGATASVGAQARVEDGRGAVGLNEESELCALQEMKCYVDLLQANINWMIRCVGEKKGVGVGCGPREVNLKGASGGLMTLG